MRFWPFGKDEEGATVEYLSRVVNANATDGPVVRAKLNVVFVEAVPEARGDATITTACGLLQKYFEQGSSALLVGTESDAAASVMSALPASGHVRSVDVMAIHIVGESPSEAPRGARMPSSPSLAGPQSSRPPPGPSPRSRRPSSSQMLAVRETRLVPAGATVDQAGASLQALLRDSAIRVLLGVLRAYDLTEVRAVSGSEDDLAEIVPQSTVAPGRFELERRPEILRWEERLGADLMTSLRDEAHALVCAFLRSSMSEVGVAEDLARGVLNAAAHSAFPEGAPVMDGEVYSNERDELASLVAVRTLAILTLGKAAKHEGHASYELAITSLVASLRADFTFAAEQVKLSRLRVPSIAGG